MRAIVFKLSRLAYRVESSPYRKLLMFLSRMNLTVYLELRNLLKEATLLESIPSVFQKTAKRMLSGTELRSQ
jgi:hypothetical protein